MPSPRWQLDGPRATDLWGDRGDRVLKIRAERRLNGRVFSESDMDPRAVFRSSPGGAALHQARIQENRRDVERGLWPPRSRQSDGEAERGR